MPSPTPQSQECPPGGGDRSSFTPQNGHTTTQCSVGNWANMTPQSEGSPTQCGSVPISNSSPQNEPSLMQCSRIPQAQSSVRDRVSTLQEPSLMQCSSVPTSNPFPQDQQLNSGLCNMAPLNELNPAQCNSAPMPITTQNENGLSSNGTNQGISNGTQNQPMQCDSFPVLNPEPQIQSNQTGSVAHQGMPVGQPMQPTFPPMPNLTPDRENQLSRGASNGEESSMFQEHSVSPMLPTHHTQHQTHPSSRVPSSVPQQDPAVQFSAFYSVHCDTLPISSHQSEHCQVDLMADGHWSNVPQDNTRTSAFGPFQLNSVPNPLAHKQNQSANGDHSGQNIHGRSTRSGAQSTTQPASATAQRSQSHQTTASNSAFGPTQATAVPNSGHGSEATPEPAAIQFDSVATGLSSIPGTSLHSNQGTPTPNLRQSHSHQTSSGPSAAWHSAFGPVHSSTPPNSVLQNQNETSSPLGTVQNSHGSTSLSSQPTTTCLNQNQVPSLDQFTGPQGTSAPAMVQGHGAPSPDVWRPHIAPLTHNDLITAPNAARDNSPHNPNQHVVSSTRNEVTRAQSVIRNNPRSSKESPHLPSPSDQPAFTPLHLGHQHDSLGPLETSSQATSFRPLHQQDSLGPLEGSLRPRHSTSLESCRGSATHIPSIPNLPHPFSIPQVHSRWTGGVPSLPDSNLPCPAKQPISVPDRGTLVGNHDTTQTYASAPLGVSSESRSTKQPLSVHDSNPRIENSSIIPASSVSYLSAPQESRTPIQSHQPPRMTNRDLRFHSYLLDGPEPPLAAPQPDSQAHQAPSKVTRGSQIRTSHSGLEFPVSSLPYIPLSAPQAHSHWAKGGTTGSQLGGTAGTQSSLPSTAPPLDNYLTAALPYQSAPAGLVHNQTKSGTTGPQSGTLITQAHQALGKATSGAQLDNYLVAALAPSLPHPQPRSSGLQLENLWAANSVLSKGLPTQTQPFLGKPLADPHHHSYQVPSLPYFSPPTVPLVRNQWGKSGTTGSQSSGTTRPQSGLPGYPQQPLGKPANEILGQSYLLSPPVVPLTQNPWARNPTSLLAQNQALSQPGATALPLPVLAAPLQPPLNQAVRNPPGIAAEVPLHIPGLKTPDFPLLQPWRNDPLYHY